MDKNVEKKLKELEKKIDKILKALEKNGLSLFEDEGIKK